MLSFSSFSAALLRDLHANQPRILHRLLWQNTTAFVAVFLLYTQDINPQNTLGTAFPALSVLYDLVLVQDVTSHGEP